MSEYSDDDQAIIRRAALGAVSLVSTAQPGFFDMFRESLAGSKVFAAAPQHIRELISGGLTLPPRGSAEEIESEILSDLTQATRILAVHPEDLQGFREVVLEACQRAAEAADGVGPEEEAVMQRIREAVSHTFSQPSPGSPDLPAAPPPLS
ncbi:MAG: hypothetical protein IPI32_07020 [Austwickia sp.]|jgi:hypothetical protein|nr:hypothetical protein [Austwickia sp.]MBK8437200.1 hypothetical protein [Austwickia sp.]MBK9102431.1 hypothetical protein [Austwickia sp.]